jgi:RNA polymerase sigma factor (sigma-70 family)
VTTLIQYVLKIARNPSLESATDLELLTRFAKFRDEAAFAQLVQRHASLVFGVCVRTLGNVQEAEDAFQATFLVLARKASSIRKAELLSNWLYGVARRAAGKARARALCRRLREQSIEDFESCHDEMLSPRRRQKPCMLPEQEVETAELHSMLDEEVARLPQRYRLPFVLCYLQGETNAAAAQKLHCPKGTVQSRLAWARQRLRNQLTRRGYALSVVMNEIDRISISAPAHVTAAMSYSTTKVAVTYAAGKSLASGAVSASVASLAEGVLHTMFMIKLKSAAIAVFVVLLAGAAAGVMARPTPIPSPAESPSSFAVGSPNFAENEQKELKIDPPAVATEVQKKTFKTGKNPVLALQVFDGGIEVITREDNSVTVEIIKESRALDHDFAKEALKHITVNMSQVGDAIHVEATRTSQARHERLQASAKVLVPPGAALDLKTSNGPVKLAGGSGDVKIATSNGPVSVKDHGGPVRLHTSNGPIHLTGGKGLADLHTSNGTIDIQATGARLDAKTSNGPIEFKGTLSDGKHSFHSSNGGILLLIPAESHFKIDASTSHGKITTGFNLDASSDVTKTHVRGKVGGDPNISLAISTSNGSISVRPLASSKSG